MAKNRKKCPDCKGTGIYKGFNVVVEDCLRCEGKGTIPMTPEEISKAEKKGTRKIRKLPKHEREVKVLDVFINVDPDAEDSEDSVDDTGEFDYDDGWFDDVFTLNLPFD